MKYQFTLPNFQKSIFEMKYSTWFGEQSLYKDDVPLERSKEKGKPFLIPTKSGEILKAYPKKDFPSIVQALEIDQIQHNIVEKLRWYDFAIALLPFCLVFIFNGKSILIAIALVAFLNNLDILRTNSTQKNKYLKVIGQTAVIAALYFVAIQLLQLLK